MDSKKKKIIAGVLVAVILLFVILGYGYHKSSTANKGLDGSKWTDTAGNMYVLAQDTSTNSRTYKVSFTPASATTVEPTGFTTSFTVGLMGGIKCGTVSGTRKEGTITWSGDGAPQPWTLST